MNKVFNIHFITSATKVDGGYVFTLIYQSICLFVNKTSRKVVDGFSQNFVTSLGIRQGRND